MDAKTIQKQDSGRCKLGIAGLDEVLNGGLPCNRLYLVQGEPGTGKTTLALQFLMEGARNGEKGLYITFSESREELLLVAESHGWSLDGISLLELSALEDQLQPEAQNTVFHPAEVEMNQITDIILKKVTEEKPVRVVFDSVSEMRMLAENSLRYRRQMLALKQFFSGKQCTVVLLDDLTASPGDLQVQSIVHGVLNLQRLHPEFGTERRRLSIVKVRGIQYTGGYHDYIIRKGGIAMFPRMISADQSDGRHRGSISTDISEFDELLGGGIDCGTSNLFLGPAGTGKSTLALQIAFAAAERGEKAAVFAFEESVNTLLTRTESIGMDIKKHMDSGLIEVRKIDPAQLSPGEFAEAIRTAVIERDLKVLVIDSLNGYLHAMPQEKFLTLQLHELLSFLSRRGVATIMVLAQQGLMGMMNTPIDLTYLADTVVITRYFEVLGRVKKAVSVVKKRGGFHEDTIRELHISSNGVRVGRPLENFQGVLTGVPTFHGNVEAFLGPDRNHLA